MNLMGRVIGLTLIALSMSHFLYADEIQIPFAVYVDEFKEDAKLQGLDLDGNKKSMGFIKDEGSHFTVFTYRQIPIEKLDKLTALTWKHIRK